MSVIQFNWMIVWSNINLYILFNDCDTQYTVHVGSVNPRIRFIHTELLLYTKF